MMDFRHLPHCAPEDFEHAPLERAETIPSSWYTHPGFLELEKECIFASSWQMVGHLSLVKKIGDHCIAECGGNPILVVKDNQDVVRGFYNVCRHRGGPLATENGCSKMLQCKYHGWTYQLDGSLRGVPKFDRTELFDKKDFGLVPVHTDVWEDLIFVNIDRNPTPLEVYLRGVVERIAPARISGKTFARRANYVVESNWKVYVDNYLEGYHIPLVHPELCKLLDTQQYRTELSRFFSLQYSPITAETGMYAQGGGGAFYFFIFPNLMLNILPGRLQTNVVLPLTHERCIVLFEYYYDDVRSDAAKRLIEEDVQYSDRIQEEDAHICAHVQKGLASRAYTRGRFSAECEQGVHHFQGLLKEHYKRWFNALEGGRGEE